MCDQAKLFSLCGLRGKLQKCKLGATAMSTKMLVRPVRIFIGDNVIFVVVQLQCAGRAWCFLRSAWWRLVICRTQVCAQYSYSITWIVVFAWLHWPNSCNDMIVNYSIMKCCMLDDRPTSCLRMRWIAMKPSHTSKIAGIILWYRTRSSIMNNNGWHGSASCCKSQ